MFESIEFYLAIIAVCIAGVIRGFSGFGAGMILVPSLSILYSPVVAVVTVVLLEIIPIIQLLPGALSKCDWRNIVPMSITSIIMIPIGSMVLINMNPEVMRISIAILLLFCVVVLMTGWRYKGEYNRWTSSSTGMLSGFISGSTSLGGLPVVLYFLSGKQSQSVTRASIVVFLVITALIALFTYFSLGIISNEVVLRTSWYIPFFVVSIWLGGQLFGKVSDVTFRRVTLFIIGSAGFAMLFA